MPESRTTGRALWAMRWARAPPLHTQRRPAAATEALRRNHYLHVPEEIKMMLRIAVATALLALASAECRESNEGGLSRLCRPNPVLRPSRPNR